MFVVWGHKYDLRLLCQVQQECPKCNQAPLELHHGQKRFTLYWIPTFTTSEGYFLKCPRCNDDALYEIDAGLAAGLQQFAAEDKKTS
jgi:hypothetical protein